MQFYAVLSPGHVAGFSGSVAQVVLLVRQSVFRENVSRHVFDALIKVVDSLRPVVLDNGVPLVEGVFREQCLEVGVESRTLGEVQLRLEFLPFLEEGEPAFWLAF